MDTVLAQSPLLPLKRSKKARTDNAASIFLLLRYLLIIAASYLFLFGAQSSASVLAGVMIAMALLSNVIVSQFSEHRLMRPLSLGIILSFDIVWITFGLWYEGIFGGNMVVLYYLILFLAAVGQSLFLMIGASVALSAFDLCLFILSGGDWATVWTTQSLIRIPFMFIAALFYGYLMEKVGKEKKIGEERIQALREIEMAITSSLDLRAVLDVLLEKINVFLPYAVVTVTLVNKKTGELEPMACRNLDETEWKEVIARRIRLDKISERDHAAVIILNAQTDPRSQQSEFLRKNGLVSYLRVPLAAKNQVSGFLTLFTREEHVFDAEEVEFLTTFASQAAIAIDHSQLYEEMSRSNKIKDEFLNVMSHELRTPINVVIGYAQLLNDGTLGVTNSQQAAAIDTIAARSKDLLNMINSLLYATSLEGNGASLDAAEVSLKDLVLELETDYQSQSTKDLSLIWNYAAELPNIETDGAKLKWILQSIINNAIKFTEKGAVTTSVRYFPNDKKVQFAVADTGIGISPEETPHIFERFHQVDSSQSRSFEGVGLGLYIVTELTALLGGKIAVESELEKGSTFTLTIPTEIVNSRD
ncbi:MAG TPA: MFS domain-containing histidine kinase [Candidatus Saccharimonadales bacterium]|nr:MFS domain-containing histidine kinase [Candidatus Saccharimonadales bacterium]